MLYLHTPRHDRKSPQNDDDYPRQLRRRLPDVTRSYCQQHRRLFDRSRGERYEFSEDESLVNSLESSTSRSVCSRRTTTSTYSCLGSVTTSKKKTRNGKRVDFGEVTHASNKTRRNSPQTTLTDDHEMTQAFECMSLSHPRPRVVKPRDVLRRPTTRKMMIYPPEGQKGEPLTLSKRRSEIQCRVSGDEATGFRYKVYYLQTFESDKWLSNDKTNSPFRQRDDPSDDSTDYTN